ncbi:MAG: serine hydrolase domain-containing protein [Bacteroidota bacterium]
MYRFVLWGILPILLLPACQVSSPSSTQDTLLGKIDSLLQTYHEQNAFNGTALVLDSGKVLYQKALGLAQKEPDEALTMESVFYLGSLAKQFTAMAVMLLQYEEKLDYDRSIRTYLPELPPLCDSITPRHMLTHTSGLWDYYGLGAYKDGFRNEDVWNLVQEMDSLEFAPGTQYSYSNTAYVLLSMLVEKLSGQTFGEYLKEHIFDPLEMNSSVVFDLTEPDIANRVTGYTSEGNPDDYKAFTTGGGGIFSNIPDLLKWEASLYSNSYFPQTVIQDAYQPYQLTDTSFSYYGFGWRIDEENGNIVQHSGSLAGFRTFMYRDIDRQLVVILLSNFTNDVGELTEQVVELVR